MNRLSAGFAVGACLLALGATCARAGEIGHYVPGLPNIRDFAVPDPGFYSAIYDYWYSTDQLNDGNGDKVSSVRVGPGPGVKVNVDVNVDLYAVSPMFIWVTDYKIAGAKYAAYIAPSFATASIGASLSTATGRGLDGNVSSHFGVGDLLVQPIWLGWSLTNWDFAVGYGVYAPIGRYNTENLTLPNGASITAEATDNIGLGFWTHQLQGAASWYPWADKRMAVAAALTYEIHSEKEDYDLTPGQDLTLNYGVSQYLPLTKDQKLLLEIGPAGYSSWQITDDTGSDAKNPNVHDEVQGIGGQLGLTYVPWLLSVNTHYFHEYSAEDRFQGEAYGVNLAKKF